MKGNIACSLVAVTLMSIAETDGNAQGLITPPSTIDGLTHQYGHYAPFGAATMIEDYAASNQFTQTGFTTTLTGSELITGSFEAPAGQMFVIHPAPDAFGDVVLQVQNSWVASSGGGGSFDPISLSAIFENLAGPTPSLISSTTGIGRGDVLFACFFTVSPGTSFTGIQLSAQYASSVYSPVQQAFTPNTFIFSAYASSSEILGDGTLMTLEQIPEPSAFTLILLAGGGILIFSKKRKTVT